MPPLGFGLYRGRKSPKASTTRIEQDISAMVKRTSNKHQIAQFWKTVQLALKEKPRKEGDIETRLQYVVSGVKTKIDAVSVDGQPHRESCRIILQSGSEEVRSILVKNGKSPRKIQKMIGEEKEAIQEDKKLDENLVRNTSTVQPKSDWTIYFMDEPQREPHLPETKLHGYNDVMRYLNIEEIIKSPELWIKCSDGNFQTFTSSRSCWIYVKPSESVGEMVLYVVDMQKRTHDTYLVALVHEGDDNEFPVPIDIAIFGKDPCACHPGSGTLDKYLRSKWQNQYRVHSARRFNEPEKCVLDTPLNTLHFETQKNELYVSVKRDTH